MQTSQTRRPSRAQKPAAAPFSSAAARLIEQIQAEARDQLLTDLSAKDAIVVLHGFDAETRYVRARSDCFRISDSKGNETHLYRHYQEPDVWRNKEHMAGYWHPARWYGNQTMVDGSGAEWSRSLGVHVCDDFGYLVKVAE